MYWVDYTSIYPGVAGDASLMPTRLLSYEKVTT